MMPQNNATQTLTVEQAIEQEVCIECMRPAMSNCFTDEGVEEYYLSGVCERCYDMMNGFTGENTEGGDSE